MQKQVQVQVQEHLGMRDMEARPASPRWSQKEMERRRRWTSSWKVEKLGRRGR